MGLYDRDYTQADYRSDSHYAPRMRMGLPKVTSMVKRLLIINTVVFLVCFLITPVGRLFFSWFSVYPLSLWMSVQPWRPITYQFLHGGLRHIFWNMLILFFFGPMLERLWGGRKFLNFYLVCGAMGGILYPLLALVGWLDKGQLVGASGSILGLLAAGAILYPNMMVYVLGIIPVRLVVIAIVLAGISIITLLRPEQFTNAGGEAAHLAGLATGAIYVFSERWRTKFSLKARTGRWQRKMAEQRKLQSELDRILQKVHDSGIHSLTTKEKRILKKATEAEQVKNKL